MIFKGSKIAASYVKHYRTKACEDIMFYRLVPQIKLQKKQRKRKYTLQQIFTDMGKVNIPIYSGLMVVDR